MTELELYKKAFELACREYTNSYFRDSFRSPNENNYKTDMEMFLEKAKKEL